MNRTKISVIVPVYNVEMYLSQCINSILEQTFSDFEILLIDDGSTDNSGIICDEFVKKDTRIHVYHKSNRGVSSARNLGLSKAVGEWVTFVDGDDLLNRKSLENYTNKRLYEDTLYVQQTRRMVQGNMEYWPIKFNNKDINLKEVSDYNILNMVLYYGTPWGKLYNMEIIRRNHLKFDETISLHEDHCFYFDYIGLIRNVTIIENVGYYYRIVDNRLSLSSKSYSCEKLQYAYQSLYSKLCFILNANDLDKIKLKPIFSFIYYIRIRALKAAFYNNETRDTCLSYLKGIEPKDVVDYYHPNSISAKLFKRVLLCKSQLIRYYILLFFRLKLK